MQLAFGFGADEDIAWVRDRLRASFGAPGPIVRRTPIGQLVKSLISSRTRDEVSAGAYRRLVEVYPGWSDLAQAPTRDVEALIGDVTFPEDKALHLGDALRIVAADHPDFDLTFLGRLGVARALVWLERLPGVGPKVAASTLNFSTLNLPAFVIDSHVLRILRRFGLVRSKADISAAYHAVMAVLGSWSALDLAELHILMKILGQTVCHAERRCCPNCPIAQRCRGVADR